LLARKGRHGIHDAKTSLAITKKGVVSKSFDGPVVRLKPSIDNSASSVTLAQLSPKLD